MEPANLIAVGEIIKAQGIKGELKVIPLTENPHRFGQIRRVFFQEAKGSIQELYLQSYRLFNEYVLLKFDGIDDMTAAEALGRGYLLIPKEERPTLPEGRYYHDEIIGLEVWTTAGESLGTVDQVFQTGANDVYSVRSKTRQILIPALKRVILGIDLAQGRMVVELPEGLVEEER